MLERFRHLHISLGAKCQVLFGIAVILTIAVALSVPWKRLQDLTAEVNLQTADALASQTVLEHEARQIDLRDGAHHREAIPSTSPGNAPIPLPISSAGNRPMPNSTREASPPADASPAKPSSALTTENLDTTFARAADGSSDPTTAYIWPRMIPVNPPKSMELDHFERSALSFFAAHPEAVHFPSSYRVKDAERYRLATPLYGEASCLGCHADNSAGPGPLGRAAVPAMAASFPSPALSLAASAPSTAPIEPRIAHKLLGVVVVDIPSRTADSPLNRLAFIVAGLVAGSLALGAFYLITTRLILRPVRVLQETAEKVSQGDLNIRADISTGDEFQQLSETLNTMLINLKTSDEQLRASNKALDLKLGQLAETNVALYESNRLKSEFLANVSHELRTPLNSILGFAELLRETVSSSHDAKSVRYLQNILTSGRNLLELINDLLDLAKIEAGRMEVRSEPLSLGDVFEGLINLLKPLTEPKEVTVLTEVSPDVPIIRTDPAKLQQVLYNFLSNAIKFSPKSGKVYLAARMEDARRVRIDVKDEGPGIDPRMHDTIFEKFRQIDGSVTRQHSGTGLGLSIAKELTYLLGGEIGVQSVLGAGATFWILMPLQTQPGQRDVRAKMILS